MSTFTLVSSLTTGLAAQQQLPPSAEGPGMRAPAAPLWPGPELTGEDQLLDVTLSSEVPVRLTLSMSRAGPVLVQCDERCRVELWPGRYWLHVSAGPGTAASAREVVLLESGRLEVSPRGVHRPLSGYFMGVLGAATLVGGIACAVACREDHQLAGGLGGLAAAIPLNIVGWLRVGQGHRPGVKLQPHSPRGWGWLDAGTLRF